MRLAATFLAICLATGAVAQGNGPAEDPFEQSLFEAARDAGTVSALDLFLQSYPQGRYSATAREMRRKLLAETTPRSTGQTARTPVRQQPATPPAPSASRTDVREIQALLNRLGYDAGPVDGVMGSRTRRAIDAFQAASGMARTGTPSRALAQRLSAAVAARPPAPEPPRSAPQAPAAQPAPAPTGESVAKRMEKVRRTFRGKDLIAGVYKDHLYVIVLTWENHDIDEARRLARRAGGTLASLTTRGEADFVMKLARSDDRLWDLEERNGHLHGPGIGIFQQPGAREPKGGWVWDSGEPVRYTAWTDGQPDNYRGQEHTAELWIHKNRNGQRRPGWNDTPDINRSFVIEIP